MTVDSCPWDTRPKTVAGMLASCLELIAWERDNKQRVPYEWCITPTHHFMMDLCVRTLVDVEDPKQ